jgi:hypothetical protein
LYTFCGPPDAANGLVDRLLHFVAALVQRAGQPAVYKSLHLLSQQDGQELGQDQIVQKRRNRNLLRSKKMLYN